jgi:hypothetical protein
MADAMPSSDRSSPNAADLVQGRDCGGCTLCCRVPPVDTPEFQKQAGVLCQHCEPEVGCAIHATRPPVCRGWFCGWRRLPLLDDSWRPDRCGVLVVLGADETPVTLSLYKSTKFIVTDDGAWIATPGFLSYVAGLVHAGVATYLAVPGPAEHHALKALLNARLDGPVHRRDGHAIATILNEILADLREGPFEPVELEYGPAAFRL